MGPLLVLVPPCFRKNVIVTCKLSLYNFGKSLFKNHGKSLILPWLYLKRDNDRVLKILLLFSKWIVQIRNRRGWGGEGVRVPPETSDREISADLPEQKGKRGENGEEKKENGKEKKRWKIENGRRERVTK